ncbi:MAG: signal peptidase I [Nitrososphaerales archaeon]|nr:signal peptidase I [Nitrososphaerales archaeon]
MRPVLHAAAYLLVLALLVGSFAFFTLVYTRKVTGTSMYPTLEEGDLVVVRNTPVSSINVGTIIVYNPPCSTTGASVIHRVVSEGGGGFITKGDNNFATDQQAGIAAGPVTPSCVEGTVVFVVPYLEKLAFLPYDANYIFAALLIAILVYGEVAARRKGEPESAPVSSP